MGYRLEADFAFHSTTPEGLTLNEFLDRVDIHLVDKLHGEDVTIVSDAKSSLFTVSMTADGESEAEAFNASLVKLRTAFHAEDASTPEWPTWTEYKNAGLIKKSESREPVPA